ncbi:MAG: HAD-IA family hydrolase [Deltaproteobacteria bacterium]|nr:HAD-IA family hydrolase [Deltaproteobacteria bacterium]
MKYKTIIYDLDGTLVDSKKDIFITTNYTITQMGGTQIPEETVYKCVGKGVRDLLLQALPFKDDGAQARALEIFKAHYLDHCTDHTRLYPHAMETLTALGGLFVPQAVLTNKPQVYTDKILKGLGVMHFFSVMIGAESGFPLKPDITAVTHILKQCHTTPAEALFVGDSEIDRMTAQNAGMDCALLLGGYTNDAEISAFKNDRVFVCKDFREVRELIHRS